MGKLINLFPNNTIPHSNNPGLLKIVPNKEAAKIRLLPFIGNNSIPINTTPSRG